MKRGFFSELSSFDEFFSPSAADELGRVLQACKSVMKTRKSGTVLRSKRAIRELPGKVCEFGDRFLEAGQRVSIG